MTENQKNVCHGIIHAASVSAGAIGASPIPGSDAIPICAVQMGMIIALGAEFEISIAESYAFSLAKEFAVKEVGKFIAGSLFKIIPGVGSAVNCCVAAGLTEALGWEVAREFYKQSQAAA